METHTKVSCQQWFRLIAAVKYGLLFTVILVAMPFAALPNGPLHDLLGGLFISLDRWDIFWTTLGALLLSWSIMFTEGFVVDDLSGRTVDDDAYIPTRMQSFLNESLSPRQLAVFSCFSLPTALFVCFYGMDGFGIGALAAALGVVAAFVVLIVCCTPVRLVCCEEKFRPVAINWIESIWNWLGRWTAAKTFCRNCAMIPWNFCNYLSRHKWFRFLFTSGVGPNAKGETVPLENPLAHYFAATVFIGILGVGIVVALVFKPDANLPKPPALAYLYCMLILTTWAFAFFRVHVRRWDISPLWIMIPAISLFYHLLGADHFFKATPVQNTAKTDLRLTPVEAIGTNSGNIVIVTSTGGGILAAGWTTTVMDELAAQRPDILKEIKLISGVSGGAVGAAFFADSLIRHSRETNILYKTKFAFTRSTAASLDELTYGLAMVDFPRILSGGCLPPTWGQQVYEIDRGNWLEFAWQRNAAGDKHSNAHLATSNLVPSFYEYNNFVKQQIAPSLIFSSTVMESGERVMFTNNRFAESWVEQTRFTRARTFEEYCLGDSANNHDGIGADLSMWSAARMSATFPWVSPAARPHFSGAVTNDYDGKPSPLLSHHFVDGGYYDNYGVSSAMDWLNPVLQDRLQTNTALRFNKIVIVQLRAYEKPNLDPAANGWDSAVLGPPLCFWSVYNSAPRVRNEIALARFMENWNARLAGKVQIFSEVVQRKNINGALSWYLSPREIEDLKSDVRHAEVQDAIAKIIATLAQN
jgi:hypothetical protein